MHRTLTSSHALPLPAWTMACVLVFAFACKRPKPTVVVHTITTESAVLPKRASPPPPAMRESLRTLRGGARRYLVLSPEKDAPTPRALVLAFHGDGGDAVGFHRAWAFERASGDEATVVYLDGLHHGWDLETTNDNPDVAYVDAVLAELGSDTPYDPARVFATGYSSGGFFASVLSCHRPGRIRAIASNAGGAPYNQKEKWPNGFPKCPGQMPVAMLALHGLLDSGVTPDSGRFSADYWGYVNGCSASERETTGYPFCVAYRGCKIGKPVALCEIPTLSHWVWDEAATASWTFFRRLD